MVLMAVFALGNLGSALAATFGSLMVARFLAGLPHGAYFGVASVVAAALVPANRRAQAVSLVMVGLTVANIAGVPGATWLGQVLGWQALYVAVTAIALACLVATLTWVPPVHIGDGPATIRSELSALARPQVWFTLVVGMVGFGGMFATYSYIAPTVTTLAGLGELGVVAILATYGVGMTIGMVVGGRLADRALLPTLYLGLVGLAVVLAVFGFLVTTPVGAFIGVFRPGRRRVRADAGPADPVDGRRPGRSVPGRRPEPRGAEHRQRLRRLARRPVLAVGMSYAWPSRVAIVLPLVGLAVLAIGRWVERRSDAARV